MTRLRVCAEFGCGYPEGECLGTCSLLHRVNTNHLPDDRPAFVTGVVESRPSTPRHRMEWLRRFFRVLARN